MGSPVSGPPAALPGSWLLVAPLGVENVSEQAGPGCKNPAFSEVRAWSSFRKGGQAGVGRRAVTAELGAAPVQAGLPQVHSHRWMKTGCFTGAELRKDKDCGCWAGCGEEC